MQHLDLSLTVNGSAVRGKVEPRTHLADFLREDKMLTGTHLGCEQGVCGACTLLVDGRPVRSCLTLAVACDGSDVRTVEGFDDDPLMVQIRDAFTRHHGLQCGFCTPGMLATAYDIVRRLPDADDDRIRRELSGNLCRCTGYAGIVDAIRDVLHNKPAAAQFKPVEKSRRSFDAETSMPNAGTVEAKADAAQLSDEGLGDISDGVTLTRSLIVDAPLEDVWAVMRDLPTVVSCIPGASLDGAPVGDKVTGRCIVSMGPMKASFIGVAIVDLDDQKHTGSVVGRGRDGLTRSTVDGALSFSLDATDDNTCNLSLEMTYKLKGPLTQFGRKSLVEDIADRILTDTTAALAAHATGNEPSDTSAPSSMSAMSLFMTAVRGFFKRLFRL
tara:strand:- start:37490 stop:38644 length:1155 start_codon:yes stop_codon:yes gene_type:complete